MYLIHAPFYFPEGGFNLKDGSVRLDVPTDLPGTWKVSSVYFSNTVYTKIRLKILIVF